MTDGADIERAIGRIEQKVDQVLEMMPEHEGRIRSLEQSRARQGGMAAAVAAAVSLATGWAGYILNKP